MQPHLAMIQELVEYIEANRDSELNIIKTAKSFHLSPWHFQRLFKSIVGDSIGGYIRGRRLTFAANALLESHDNVIDVALGAGFQTHESFTRAFKKHFGLSPKAFRNERPNVRPVHKPQLSDALLEHITKGMEKEPLIVERKAQRLAGFATGIPSPFFGDETICELIGPAWQRLFEVQKVSGLGETNCYYGLTISPSGSFTEEKLTHLAALPVQKGAEVNEDMVIHEVPKQTVAMFDTRTNIEADILKKTIDYIYGYWLPNSGFSRGEGDDYEYFEDVVDFETGDFRSYYVIPLKTVL